MKEELNLINECFEYLLKDSQIHSVTAFCIPLKDVKKRIRVTRKIKNMGYHVEIGSPNYSERQFLKLCKKAKTKPKKFRFKFFKEN